MIINVGAIRFILDLLAQSFAALKDNRLRTFLSILGIAIGIAAVIAVGTVSKGGHYLIFSELKTFGLNSLWVYRDRRDKDPHRVIREGSGINNQDYRAITSGCCPAVQALSAVVHSNKRVLVHARNHYSNARVKGVDVAYTRINNDNLVRGRGFRPQDILSRREVAIIGPTARVDLFGESSDPIGKEFRIGERKFTVIGLLKGKSRDFLASIGSSGGQDANNRILIPYTLYQLMLGKRAINFLHAEATSLQQADTAAKQIITLLHRRNGQHFSYKSETMASYIATTNRILGGVSIIGIIAASVSLLVGGMGIMNIMSTSVLERTREIGIRKAVGARHRDILLQFLFEAVLISSIGGVIGLSLGAFVSILLALFTGFPLTPSLPVILIALLVSVSVGVISGFLPARRAANLHPVEALRYE
ncbi:ABC transporter permease [Beggiatoa alba]|nr:ABC transporter permease [Beggiatoa alba]